MKTVCIDVDGTLCEYVDWNGPDHFGKLLPGAKEALQDLKAKGWFIIIYTTRRDSDKISSFLKSNDICFDAINMNPFQPDNAKGGKPIADVYIDDRAITFRGNWDDTLREVYSFKPWEE